MENIHLLRLSELLAIMGKFASSLSSEKEKMSVFAAMNLARDSRLKPEHNLKVAVLAISLGLRKPDDVISALLHSSLEDGFASIESLQEMFGLNVALMVGRLTPPDLRDISLVAEIQERFSKHIKELISAKETAVITVADFYDKAFMLEECPDMEERRMLCAKYRPAFQMLISAIEAKIIRINPHLIPDILSGLRCGLAFAKKQLGES